MDGMGLSTLYFWNKRRHYCFGGGGSLKNSPLPQKKKQKCKYWKLPSDQNLITQQVTNNPLYKGHLVRTWFGNSVLSWIAGREIHGFPRNAALRSPRKAQRFPVVHHPQVQTLVCPVGSWVQICWREKFWPALVCWAFGLFLLDPLFFFLKNEFILI